MSVTCSESFCTKMNVKEYMVKVYAVLVKAGTREPEKLPEAYQVPVAEYLAKEEESAETPTT